MTWRAAQLHYKPAGIELRDVPGFPGYSVAADGRVWSSRARVFLRATPDGHGYPSVGLRRDGKTYPRKVHRLVATLWVPNPNDLPHVNHIDGNPLNSSATNLEWCTPMENSRHALITGLTPGYASPEVKAEILRLRGEGVSWREIADKTGRTPNSVRCLARGAGYRWNGKTTARVLERKP